MTRWFIACLRNFPATMIWLTTLLATTCSTQQAFSSDRPVIELTGDVEFPMLFELASRLGDVKSGDNVELFIDSPGGNADMGLAIADKIKALQEGGVKFTCVALRAYSAAFMIWAECSNRLVLAYGKVMFHYPYLVVSGKVTRDVAAEMLKDIETVTEQYRSRLIKTLWYVTPAAIDAAAKEDRIFMGREFCFTFAPNSCKVLYLYGHLEDK